MDADFVDFPVFQGARQIDLGRRAGIVRRPRLLPGLPILRRSKGLQIGIDRPDAILVESPPSGLQHWLRLLDGSRGLGETYRLGSRHGLTREEMRLVLRQLHLAGLLTDASDLAAASHPADNWIRLVGAGRIGRAIAHLLTQVELTTLELIDDDPVDASIYPRQVGSVRQSAALHAELTAELSPDRFAGVGPAMGTGPGRRPTVILGRPWPVESGVRPVRNPARNPAATGMAATGLAATGLAAGAAGCPPTAPALTVIASDRLEIDRVLTDPLLRSDQPHLLVHGSGSGVVVGPLVLPGRTACVRCTDLVRTQLDPGWPGLLAQLSRISGSASNALIGWAAATAVTQALAALSLDAPGLDSPANHGLPATANCTIELGRDFVVRRRRWPQHSECGCGWRTASAWAPPTYADGEATAAS